MKKLVIISLIGVAFIAVALDLSVYDATTGRPADCKVHNVKMSKRTVEFRWGMKRDWKTYRVRSQLFPHAEEPYESGYCLKPSPCPSSAKVFVCPQCTTARAAWLLTNKPPPL